MRSVLVAVRGVRGKIRQAKVDQLCVSTGVRILGWRKRRGLTCLQAATFSSLFYFVWVPYFRVVLLNSNY